MSQTASLGVSQLDSVLGGVPLGSLVVIEEDRHDFLSPNFLKLFLAEGVASENRLFFASPNLDAKKFLQKIPSPVGTGGREDHEGGGKGEDASDAMRIAWRYQNLSRVDEEKDPGRSFDLSTPVPEERLNALETNSYDGNCLEGVLAKLEEFLSGPLAGAPSDGGAARPKLSRVALHSLGSPFWRQHPASLPKSVYGLKSMIRRSSSVAVVSVPRSLLEDRILHKIRRQADFVLSLEWVPDTRELDYEGVLRIRKAAYLNSMAPRLIQVSDFGIKWRRNKFFLERFSLPPEKSDSLGLESMGCASNLKKLNLDF